MGYITTYTLTTVHPISSIQEQEIAVELAKKIFGDDPADLLMFKEFSDVLEESMKWYEHDGDMLELSKQYPNIVFKLKGEGEESGDIWIKYFLNGQMQYCKGRIEFDDYNPLKLH